MERQTQVEIIRELVRQLDEEVNIDAGVQYQNPTCVYTDGELATREWDELFRQHPQMIGLSGDLPETGSFVTLNDFGVPILATRDTSGTFRAFLNACRHRGVRVAGDARGKANTFTCPFHHWTYSSAGDLVAVPREHDFGDIDKSCTGLFELPAAEKYGLLWVHPRPGGELDIDRLLGGLAPELAQANYGNLVYMGESVLRNDLNWKLANDTFGETYHFPRLHKDTLGQLFYGDALHYTEFERNHRFVWAERGMDHIRNVPEEEWDYELATGQLYYLFPNIQLTGGMNACSLIKIYPDGDNPGRSITRVGHYASQALIDAYEPEDMDQAISKEEVYGSERGNAGFSLRASQEVFKSTIEQEDYLMGETTQKAAESGVMPFLKFGRNEPALHHYHNTFREALGMEPLERVR